MDERKNLEREADMARQNLNDIAGELGDRANMGKRLKTAVTGAATGTGDFVKSHPVALAVGGGVIGLLLGAMIPVGKSERSLLDRLQAKIDEAFDNLTGGLGLAGDDDGDLDADVSPDMDMTSMAGEEDALDRMEGTGENEGDGGGGGGTSGGGGYGGGSSGGSGGYKS